MVSMAKRARKHRLGLQFITQDVQDLLSEDTSRAITGHSGRALLQNAAFKLLLQQDAAAISTVGDAFDLPQDLQRWLLSCPRGDGLLLAKGNRFPVRIEATPEETEVIEWETRSSLGATERPQGERTDRERSKRMKVNPIKWLLNDEGKKPPALLAVTPPRTGERTLLGVENMLGSIAVPEPFSLELAGDADGVTLLARCLDDQVVRAQIAARYPQAQIQEIPGRGRPPAPGRRRAGVEHDAQGRRPRVRAAPGSSGTTTCSTPAPTPSSPSWARSPTSTRGSALWRG